PYQLRVIFPATAKILNRALQLFFATNQSVDPPYASKLVEISREILHPILPARLLFATWLACGIRRGLTRLIFTRPVGNKVNHVKAADFMFTQQVSRLRFLFAKDGNQHISTGNFTT